jgi:hypothetical protein
MKNIFIFFEKFLRFQGNKSMPIRIKQQKEIQDGIPNLSKDQIIALLLQ